MSLSNAFTRLIGCSVPIQNAGMGTASPELAFAVARAGALGMLSGTMVSPERLDAILAPAAALQPACLGVNFLMPFLEDRRAVDVAASRARVVEFFFGDPEPGLIEHVHRGDALAAWQVGSAGEARAAAAAGCDFIIAQGIEAGGHVRGRIGLMTLLAEVLDAVDIPVVAAGGISTPRGLAMVLAAGAGAARIGSRFVATPESGYHPDYIQKLIESSGEDTEYTERFSVMWAAPHRVLRSAIAAADALSDEVIGHMEIDGESFEVPRFSVFSPLRTASGAVDAMALYAGQGIGAIKDCRPAADIVREFAEGAEALLGGSDAAERAPAAAG